MFDQPNSTTDTDSAEQNTTDKKPMRERRYALTQSGHEQLTESHRRRMEFVQVPIYLSDAAAAATAAVIVVGHRFVRRLDGRPAGHSSVDSFICLSTSRFEVAVRNCQRRELDRRATSFSLGCLYRLRVFYSLCVSTLCSLLLVAIGFL